MRALRERSRNDSASLTIKRKLSELIIGCTYNLRFLSLDFSQPYLV